MNNLVWFRRDLRVEDNPALTSALAKSVGSTHAIYMVFKETWLRHDMGQAQQYWLYLNLQQLQKNLAVLGVALTIIEVDYFSDADKTIADFIKRHKISALYFNKEYEWDEQRRDGRVKKCLLGMETDVFAFDEQCLFPPEQILNKQHKPYTVFTPYKKTVVANLVAMPEAILPLSKVQSKQSAINSVKSMNWLPEKPNIDLDWLCPGEQAAIQALEQYVDEQVAYYQQQRDYPALTGTSKVSPYLALGVLSVRQCLAVLVDKFGSLNEVLADQGASTWLSELIWRDFYKMICFRYPRVSRGQPFQAKTNTLQWDDNPDAFERWCQGQTGVPIIDAAMRQLNQTGWMHNRLRMIVAMYLTKNLWLDWRLGESYFARQLVDWDFSANNGGWQWSASTGTDAVPYFRVFNPITQSQRFDADGGFIKCFCPELMTLNSKDIHNPSDEQRSQLNYPPPLVDLKLSRQRAIAEFKALAESQIE